MTLVSVMPLLNDFDRYAHSRMSAGVCLYPDSQTLIDANALLSCQDQRLAVLFLSPQ